MERLATDRLPTAVAVLRILTHRLSNTLTADFCVEAPQEAIVRHGIPDIVDTNQGSLCTGGESIGKLKAHGIAISIDSRGAWRDNGSVERFWKTLKYEEVVQSHFV